jgi:uncharacterized protein YneF (UPF0154 family)
MTRSSTGYSITGYVIGIIALLTTLTVIISPIVGIVYGVYYINERSKQEVAYYKENPYINTLGNQRLQIIFKKAVSPDAISDYMRKYNYTVLSASTDRLSHTYIVSTVNQ